MFRKLTTNVHLRVTVFSEPVSNFPLLEPVQDPYLSHVIASYL